MVIGAAIWGYYLLDAAKYGFAFFTADKKPNVIYYNDHLKQREINKYNQEQYKNKSIYYYNKTL